MKALFCVLLACLLFSATAPVLAFSVVIPRFITREEAICLIKCEIVKSGLVNKAQVLQMINYEVARRGFVNAFQVRQIVQQEIAKCKIPTEAQIRQLANEEIDKRGYLNAEQIQAMIDAAIAPLQTAIADLQTRVTALEAQHPQPNPIEPPIIVTIDESESYFRGTEIYVKFNISMESETGPWIPDNPFLNYFCGIDAWGVASLPQGKIFSANAIGLNNFPEIQWTIPAESLPPHGTPIPLEIHCSYGGKTWDFNLALTDNAIEPTYISPPSLIFHGNYGNSSYPCYISDETGDQLFDGIYGKYEWLKQATVQSDSDYLERYDEQKGYGLPWVSRNSGRYELATFDMKEVITLTQLGLHCYNRIPDISPPNIIEIESSNNGTDFEPVVSRGPFDYGMYTDDRTYDIVVSDFSSTARYFRIYVTMNSPFSLLIDEISINGKNGANY